MRIIALLIACILCTGCMGITKSINFDNEVYANDYNEFSPEFKNRESKYNKKPAPIWNEATESLNFSLPPALKGMYLGVTNLNGITYSHYQFAEVLYGNNRLLDILLPTSTNSPRTGIMTEGLSSTEPGSPAQLYLDGLSSILQKDIPPSHFAPHTLIYQYGNIEAVHLDPSLPQGGTWEYFPKMRKDFQWIQRDPVVFSQKKKRYFYSVPVDIITFPAQLAVVVFLGVCGSY